MVGQTLLHYKVIEKIGEGGMGTVYKAHDTHLDRPVAIKVLPPDKVADLERKQRFVQEAKAASALRHPNIIVIHDIATDRGIDFIVMELVEGAVVSRDRYDEIEEVIEITIQICAALEHAHSLGIVHRDLKPENVLITPEGVVKLTDFGLARSTSSRLTNEGLVSTTGYLFGSHTQHPFPAVQ